MYDKLVFLLKRKVSFQLKILVKFKNTESHARPRFASGKRRSFGLDFVRHWFLSSTAKVGGICVRHISDHIMVRVNQ